MVITYKNFGHVAFPAFPLPSSNWEEQDGLLYLDNKLLDDKNMKGKTLGRRRLQTPFKDLIPLKASVTDTIGLIKHGNSAFIDKTYIKKSGQSGPLGQWARAWPGTTHPKSPKTSQRQGARAQKERRKRFR